MANFGRYVCVFIPFGLTLAALIALLVGGLGGVTNKSLYVFEVNTTDFSISLDKIQSLLNSAENLKATRTSERDIASSVSGVAGAVSSALGTSNITAADVGLAGVFKISLWGYCFDQQGGNETCSQPRFDWASNVTTEVQDEFNKAATLASAALGSTIKLPDSVVSALNTFSTVVKWTEVVFIIAWVALGLELVFGFFSNFSRGCSCVTWLISGLATVATVAAATLATVLGSVVVGAIEGAGAVASGYGLQASLNTGFLTAVWVAVAFSIASGLFWIFTICCCKPEQRQRRDRSTGGAAGFSSRHLDDEAGEKLVPQRASGATHAYYPVTHEPEEHGYYENGRPVSTQSYGGQSYNAGYGQPQHQPQQSYGPSKQPLMSGAARGNMAYEPYTRQA